MTVRDARFGDLLVSPLRSGVTIPRSQRGSGIKMINMGEIFRYPRLPDVEMALVDFNHSNAARFLVEPGDLLFARRSLTAEGAGKCAIVLESPTPRTWESSIIRARMNRAIADPHYYFYMFQGRFGRQLIETIVEQVAVAGVRSSDLSNLRVPFPELTEQRAVSRTLRALDDKIAINDRIARTCRDLGQVIFISVVNRSKVAIENICSVVMGQSPPGETYNQAGRGIPFYQGTRDFEFFYPSKRVWCTAVTRHAAAGDILVSVRAPVGEVNVASQACGIGRGLAALHAHNSPHVLHHALMVDTMAWVPFEGEGTVFGSINKQQLHELNILWPDPGREARLEVELRVLDERITAALNENESLSALRDTLLPELMSGRLRVRDVEKAVEDAVW